MYDKLLFRIDWIMNTRSGNGVNTSSVYAKNMAGALTQIKKREGFFDVLSIKLYGKVDGQLQSITNVNEYDEAF